MDDPKKTQESPEFREFPKITRLSREFVITEKIDGTNAQIFISENHQIFAGSRNRWLTLDNDNYGFCHWVTDNKKALLCLGEGRHFGEWWGCGIQRGYNLSYKVFSLFDVMRWAPPGKFLPAGLPDNVGVVPVLHWGDIFDTGRIDSVLANLRSSGSVAAPGYANPEGIVVTHLASRVSFKKTFLDSHKGNRVPPNAPINLPLNYGL